MAVRILRLIEYVYQNEEDAAEDQLRWSHSFAGPKMTMKSAVLPFESVEWIDGPRGPEVSRD